jgi:hypothetical protein
MPTVMSAAEAWHVKMVEVTVGAIFEVVLEELVEMRVEVGVEEMVEVTTGVRVAGMVAVRPAD